MHNVLKTLFDKPVPFEISQVFPDTEQVHDCPEEGLFWDGQKLSFNWYDEHHQIERNVAFDFNQTYSELSKKLGPAPKELLGRAVGKKEDQLIWDLTGGTGRDALSFVRWGHRVVVFERHQIIAALLIDALRRAPEFKDKITIVYGEGMNIGHNEKPDIIFYDPMFPEELKKSRPKKEMVLFKYLTKGDEDQEEVLDWALGSGAERIIFKRPIKAAEVRPKPTASFSGKTIRFDLWQR